MMELPEGVKFTPTPHGVIIIGAGLAGLLAANMLRQYNPLILEGQATLPHNHSALLRFRSPVVGDVLNTRFKKVLVHKAIWNGHKTVNECSIPLANAYSMRATQAYLDRSIWNMEPEVRWIPPLGLPELMANGINVQFNHTTDIGSRCEFALPVISTIPMPIMIKAYRVVDPPTFVHFPIWTIKTTIGFPRTELYQTLYNGSPDVNELWYRATIHGDELTVECHKDPQQSSGFIAEIIVDGFGMKDATIKERHFKEQKFGKMQPIDDKRRKEFIYQLTEKHHIYSLGRFATWRPLLLDHIVQDVRRIEEMLTNGPYAQQLLKK